MKTKTKLIVLTLMLIPFVNYAQGGPNLGGVNSYIRNLFGDVKSIITSIMGIAAIVGAGWVFMKMQSAEGGEGKKALMNYLGAMLFFFVIWILLDAVF